MPDNTTLTCRVCLRELPLEAFTTSYRKFKRHRHAGSRKCKECVHRKNSEGYQRHRAVRMAYMARYRRETKDAAFQAYGGFVCKCCGETERLFLDIDHIANNGGKHRKELGIKSGNHFYIWLKKNNYPPGFQILCSNCNRGKFRNGGVCPHQTLYAKAA